ncbi:chemotaxis protein [Vibrio xuii]|nr:chemotaxis protein [Vibrio xuii]
MNNFSIKNLSIRSQALLPVFMTSIILLLTLWVAKDKLIHEQEEIELHTNSMILYKDTLAKIDDTIYPLRISGVYALFNDSLRTEFIQSLDITKKAIEQNLQNISNSNRFDAEVEAVHEAIEEYLRLSELSVRVSNDHDRGALTDKQYQDFIASYQVAGQDMVESINILSNNVNTYIITELEESKTINEQVQFMTGIAVSFVLFASLVTCYFLSNIIVIPVQKIQGAMKEMAEGNLTVRVEVEGKNEITHLSQYVNSTAEKFDKTVSKLNEVSEQVASSSTQLAAVMNQSELNAQQELVEIEQVASAANQLASTAENVNENALLADKIANEAKSFANQGLELFEETKRANAQMSDALNHAAEVVLELKTKSDKINDVIEVIGNVSEQTNLLALNAAIEAARAGESGRGFAVVADEVRNLAARTQESTTEIQGIVEDLQTHSSLANERMETSLNMLADNNQLTAQANDAVIGITESVKQINDANSHVATAASEQLQVTQEINRNITNISELVNQNVTGVSQSAAASEELSVLAENQKKQLAFFQI